MDQLIIDRGERLNSLSSPTDNEEFDKNGYLIVRNLWDAERLYSEPPKVKGRLTYNGKIDEYDRVPVEEQVQGSTSRHSWPPYKYPHSKIKLKLEKIIGMKLFPTYCYDRFYSPGQKLEKHVDKPACEISVTVHVSSNVSNPWPIWIKTPDTYESRYKREILKKGEDKSVILHPGDGMIYKGCERPHWREILPEEGKDGLYYHQVFFHYVLCDGYRAQYANTG